MLELDDGQTQGAMGGPFTREWFTLSDGVPRVPVQFVEQCIDASESEDGGRQCTTTRTGFSLIYVRE